MNEKSKYEMYVRCPVCGSKDLEYSFNYDLTMWWHCKNKGCGNAWKDKPKEEDENGI